MKQNKSLRSALKCLLLASVIPSLANAESFTLDYTPIQTCLTPYFGISHQDYYDYNFTNDDVTAELNIQFNSDNFTFSEFNMPTFTDYYQVRSQNLMTEFTIRSLSFNGKFINSVIIDAFMYNSDTGHLSNEDQQYIINCGDNKIFSNEIPTVNAVIIREKDTPIDFKPIEINVNSEVTGELTISILSSGGDLAFKSITIIYGENITPVEAPEVSMTQTQVVGQQIILESDVDDAKIYYSIDGGNWNNYDPIESIILFESGSHTLRYKATTADGKVESEIMEEKITIGATGGLDAVRNAHKPITINGVVLGHGNGYALVGETSVASLDNAVAVESVNHAALQSATIGTEISATGMHTDKFGSNLPAIGSLSELYVNGSFSSPTSITVPVKSKSDNVTYDLLGRRNVVTTKRTIVINNHKLQLQPGRHQ